MVGDNMAYYLILKEKNKILKIDNLYQYEKLSKLKNNTYTLQEIDNFTSKFDNSEQLKQELYKKNLITLKELEASLCIVRKNKGKLEKIRYNPVYKEDKKYLDTNYLTNLILSLSNDREYLEKLVIYYRNSYINSETITIIKYYLLPVNQYMMIDYNIIETLRSFILKEIYNFDYNKDEATLKYKSLHDLAMFTKNYVDSKKKTENKPNRKILKKNNVLEGQISMF